MRLRYRPDDLAVTHLSVSEALRGTQSINRGLSSHPVFINSWIPDRGQDVVLFTPVPGCICE